MIARILVALFAGSFLTVVGWLAWSAADRSAPIADVKLIISSPDAVRRGASLHMDVEAFYLRSCTTYVKRMLFDSRGTPYTLPELPLPATDIGFRHSASDVPIADGFALGEARYVSHPSYGCNWFQRAFWPIAMPERVASFNVVASK
jgi:hypothetical protein